MNKLNKILMLDKSIKLFLTVLVLGNIFQAKAQEQDRLPFDQGREYILADVKVIGKVSYNEQTIVTFAGLQKGQKIVVPGEEISTAIKKLWKLGLFNEIDTYVNRIEGDSIFIDMYMTEVPGLNEVKIQGVKKGKIEALIKENNLTKGKKVNENLITTTKNYLENKYKKDGFYNTKVAINTIADTTDGNNVNMVVNIDKGSKVKVSSITFNGNEQFKDGKLKKAMKNTKTRFPLRFWKGSKFINEKYQEDLTNIVKKYKEKGYRDARVVSDSVSYNKANNTVAINLNIEEGNKYYFGDIKFLGNSVYSDQGLRSKLGIEKGDVYNGVLLEKRIADKTAPDGNDITNLYQNNGYLFSTINAVEVRTANDTIDFEIRIQEGPMAYFNKISVVGNDKTNDKVIYREIRTRPGQKYSKELLVRTIRELGQLGFFDPQALEPKFLNVDPGAGTVDIEYNVVEKGSSQIELQGGYGGGGFIGTLGLSFNNFSIKNIFNKDAYTPLPMGDGQKLALRLQGSSYFQTYSLSLSEPWLGGRKPVQFTGSVSHSKQFLYSGGNDVDRDKSFNITSLSVGIAKRLNVPDDYFVLSQGISFQYYDLNNYNTGLFSFGNGSSRNLAYTIGLTRNSKAIDPIFPIQGSEFSVSAKLTLPYSLFNGVDYKNLGNKEEFQLADGSPDQAKIDQEKFKLLEYYKIKFKGDVYTKFIGKFVLRTLGEFGYLGAYNSDRGDVPFERFFVGGDGLANYSLDGREVIQLRGYENQSLTPLINGSRDGATIYNKFSLELRYPITLKGAASIYALSFLEAGGAWNGFKDYNPFSLQRSAGVGLRIFMPAFGLLGIDFGHGFDAAPGTTQKSGWQTHFIIGQQF